MDKDGDLTFKYKDKDGDFISILIECSNLQQITATTLLTIPDDYFLASTLASNHWNQRSDNGSTFSFSAGYKDKTIIFLKTSLSLNNGIARNNVKVWLENLVAHINPFEESIIADIKSLDKDSKLIKGKNAFWNALEEVATKSLAETAWDLARTTVGVLFS